MKSKNFWRFMFWWIAAILGAIAGKISGNPWFYMFVGFSFSQSIIYAVAWNKEEE